MKKRVNASLALLLAMVMALSALLPSFAQAATFDDDAFCTVVTASDFQDSGKDAYSRFENVLSLMAKDGMTTPDSALIGGDYSKIMFDYATPGTAYVKDAVGSVYPKADLDSVICIQGNHDIMSSGFVETGFYDMGSYKLYVINEDDFPWNQYLRSSGSVEKLAADVDENLQSMIDSGDTRPVIIMTHVPLHHSTRSDGGDNMYSSYLFNAVNKAAEKLDIVFLFGHNHSGAYDDYIGGSVNMLKPGDTIRLPLSDEKSSDKYEEATLNFTYANYGYVGYSNNGTDNGSTNLLTVGAIQISENNIHFVKYSEQGLYGTYDVARKTTSSAGGYYIPPQVSDNEGYIREFVLISSPVFDYIYTLINKIAAAIL